MATYNRAHLIVETLVSIQNQTYPHWECLIIDDGGTDNTKEVIAPIVEKDSRFQFLKRPDKHKKGLPGCRNYGMSLAKGNYIVFFDDDDIVHPQILSIPLEVINKNKLDFCQYYKNSFTDINSLTHLDPISEVSIEKEIVKNSINDIITGDHPIASCTVIWNKHFLDQYFNEELMYAEEWEFYSRLLISKIEFRGALINACLYYNRKHEVSNTGQFYRGNSIQKESHVKATLLLYQEYLKLDFNNSKVFRYLSGILITHRSWHGMKEMLAYTQSYSYKISFLYRYVIYPLYAWVNSIKRYYVST
jgi:glycosyltransferase involved in cell wall biosynthesis